MSPRYYPALDSLRGLFALMVALFHLRANSHLDGLLLVRKSWLFVDFFFVLSGFVIAQAYRDRLRAGQVTLRQFIWWRLARIYPLHLVMLLLFVATEYGISQVYAQMGAQGRVPFSAGRSLGLLPENLLLLQSFGLSGISSWNVPAWSISAEVWTYLLFALIATLLGRWCGRLIWLGICGLLAPALILWLNGASLNLEFDGGILRCLLGFGLGAMVSEFALPQRLGARRAQLLEIPVVAAVLLFVCFAPALQITLLAPLVFAVMLLLFAQEDLGLIGRQLCRAPFLWLGMLSYSIYMVHTYVYARLTNLAVLTQDVTGIRLFQDGAQPLFGQSLWQGDLFVAVTLLLSIAVSYFTWKLIEKPAQTYLRALYGAPPAASYGSQGSQT